MTRSVLKPSGGKGQAAAEKDNAIETEFTERFNTGKLPKQSPPPVLLVDNPIQNAKIPSLVILTDGHEWGIIYRDVAVEKKKPVGSKETQFNTKRAYYVKGLNKYLEIFPSAWKVWNAKLRGRFNSLELAISNIVAHHEIYYTIRAKQEDAGAAPPAPQGVPQQQKQPQPRPPPPGSVMVEDPNKQQQKERGFKQPSMKRPNNNAPPPGPPQSPQVPDPKVARPNDPVVVNNQPPPNRLDEEVTRLKAAFYESCTLVKSTTNLSYRTTPKISYDEIARQIRGTRGAYALKAPGLGLGYMPAHAASPSAPDELWSEWANQYNGDKSIEVAWKSFFEQLRMSNYDGSLQIIDPATQKLRPGVSTTDRGPLRLTYRGHGTYNIVYTAPTLANEDRLRYKFPPSIRKILRSVVFRVPIRDMSGREPLPVFAAARELANCLEAADGGFGPPVWVGSAFVEAAYNPRWGKDPSVKQPTVDVCELYTISTRMSMTIRELYDPVPAEIFQSSRAENIFKNLERAIEHTMRGLSDVVFAYSVRRIIHLDASLLNFMVQMNGDAHTFPERIVSARNVYAIDLDPKLYRTLKSNSTAPSAGWVCVWLYNVLFLSCQLKANVPGAVFDRWINGQVLPGKPQATLSNVIRSTIYALKSGAHGIDCNWVIQSKWKKPIGNWNFSGDLRESSSEDELMREMRELCKHYFIYILERETASTLRPFQDSRASTRDLDNAAQRYNLVCTPYSIPARRYFESRLAGEGDAQAPLLVDVLFDFLKVRLEDEFPPSLRLQLRSGSTTPSDIQNRYDSWMGRLSSLGSWPR